MRDLAARIGATESREALDVRVVDAVLRALEEDSQEGSDLASSRSGSAGAERAKAVTELLDRFDALRAPSGSEA